jgi:Restriction endonuclease
MRIVTEGMTYRFKRSPITVTEIETLDGLIQRLGMRFPDLSNERFLEAFRGDSMMRARDLSASIREVERVKQPTGAMSRFDILRTQFYELGRYTDRKAAGLALEVLLNELFEMFKLEPRKPFCVVGEQIDGSFVLDSEVYLVEAKWRAEKTQQPDLLVFREKVAAKSAHTRGMFLSINGFTDGAIDAITRGKQPVFFLADGYDLVRVLEEHVSLPSLLRTKQRALAEEGTVYMHPTEGDERHA